MSANLKFLRGADLWGKGSISGMGRTQWYDNVADGLMTPPVAISKRAKGWPASEVEAVFAARLAGATETQIRELVANLMAARAQYAARVGITVEVTSTA